MNKKENLEYINKKIDMLIAQGKEKSAEYKRLVKLHYLIFKG